MLLPLLLAACAPKAPPVAAASLDAEDILRDARALQVLPALRAAFRVSVASPDSRASTSGAMVLHGPDRARLEIYSPVGTPLFLAATDGDVLHAYVAESSTFFRGDDASAAFDVLSGGALDAVDVVAVLAGRLPFPNASVQTSIIKEGALQVELDAGPNLSVGAVLDEGTGQMRFLKAVEQGNLVLTARYDGWRVVDGVAVPQSVEVTLPALGLDVAIDVRSWDVLGQVPEVFVLSPPAKAADRDMVEALQAMRQEASFLLAP